MTFSCDHPPITIPTALNSLNKEISKRFDTQLIPLSVEWSQVNSRKPDVNTPNIAAYRGATAPIGKYGAIFLESSAPDDTYLKALWMPLGGGKPFQNG
ncbi:hypothetical protein [Rhizobium sp. WYCCWR 11146]|uniref:hypothetical protein n=1 Tax=Rhizobium sp. WYCCWR 11146 TaxID=2749833 RepID=UPI0015E75093|nr:hypothetical protein [Rhizobium sp. WYCCWR 11146]MBA1350072.1 hypothetical protein [Rhizobium sp. WYCCWR 11146]